MANEKRLIDANVLKRLGYTSIVKFWGGLVDKILPLSEAPTVDAVEVVHGYWINTPPYYASNGNYNKAQECSVCHAYFVSPGNTPYSNHPYCCECGAKMDLEV